MIRILNLSKEPNPVGEVKKVEAIEEQIVALANQWDSLIVKEEWTFMYWIMPWKWEWTRKTNLIEVTDFLIKSLDGLIILVNDQVDLGPDKKATVLDAVDRLYEYVIKEALPIWAKPFAGRVKIYIIYTLVSIAIDWIVDKYRNGEWRDELAIDET